MNKACKRLFFFLLLPALFFLSASDGRQQAPDCLFVTQIDVVYGSPKPSVLRTYTDPEKMASVLRYLRFLEYRGKPEIDPEQLTGEQVSITLHYSNSCRRVYRQRAYRYFSKNYRPWEKVDSAQAQLLYPLLQLLPGDL